MMRKEFCWIAVFLLVAGASVCAQSFQERLYECYIGRDMDTWVEVMDEMKAQYAQKASVDLLEEITLAQYGYIAIAVARKWRKEGKAELKLAEANVEFLLEHDPDWANMHALKGSLIAFKVGFDPYKIVVLGSQVKAANEVAMKLDKGSPEVWMDKGHLEMYWPDLEKDDALHAAEAYSYAVSLFEKNKSIYGNWLYINTLSSLATAYIHAGLYREADAIFRKILEVEPEVVWVRDRDYPRFKAKYM